MLATLIDRGLDWTVVPGYSRIGYAVRKGLWEDTNPEPGLAGWTVLVTGASSGIGAAACERFARAGAAVHMLVRDRERGERARARIRARTGSGRLDLDVCDVSSLASVRRYADAFAAEHHELHTLVNNAGAMPPHRTRTDEGIELTFATNVLGPFLLTRLLEGPLRRGAPSRIVWVSSGGMYTRRLQPDDLQLDRRAYDAPGFYAHAKRCEVILAELWARRLRGAAVASHSMHPGWADTPGVEAALPGFHRVMRPLLRDPGQAADTIVWLVTAAEPAARSGGFWHDRAVRPTHRLPWTRESEDDRRRLWEQCERLAGLAGGP